ncbi:hypothetical protein, partial [Raoultella planticola]|uniref:hypothetical protein n=1 Tax=Raoultella planticola TaxID=575 RepID=UPI0034E44255
AKKGAKSAQADAIYQALDSMDAHVLPLSALVQSELNVRKRPIVLRNKLGHFSEGFFIRHWR